MPARIKIPGKRSKYRNVRCEADGYKFDSKRELARYRELALLLRAGEIESLEVHKPFAIEVNGTQVCVYECDFFYFDVRAGDWVVEDTKGVRTDVYKLKKRLMRVCLGIEIREL